MQLGFLDFETYWDAEYSLSRMSPLEYVMDPRFEIISVSVAVDHYPIDVIFGHDEVLRVLRKMDWTNRAAIGHNMSGFDAYVMAYIVKVNPRLWGCTQAMARPIHAKTTGLSLAKLVEFYAAELRAMGVSAVKNQTVLMETKGRRLKDFAQDEIRRMEVYNRDDTAQCRGLFQILRKHYSAAELWQIDALTRMRTEPQFELDFGLLDTAASVVRDQKRKSLLSLARMLREKLASDGESNDGEEAFWEDQDRVTAFVRSQLASAQKFSTLLEMLGVDVPMKPSPTSPEKQVPALAKSDQAFLDLQEHDDPMVAAAAAARLEVKSTLLETRIEKFQTAGRLAGGFLPIPIKYCGADTSGRDSGEEYNPQNMPRIGPAPKPTDALRRSLRAPKGKKVIVADQSGIELRTNHFLWKVGSSMALYLGSPDKADLYRAFAAHSLFNVEPEAVTKSQRQVGKVAQLGLGFGAGAVTFQRIAKIMGGVDIPLDDPTAPLDCVRVVAAWRMAYAEIANGWKLCGNALFHIRDGKEVSIDPWGLTGTCAEGIVLPSGRLIRYPALRQEDDGEWPDGRKKKSWFYAEGRHTARLTGPKVDENIVQALARDSIFDCAVEFYKQTGLRPALRVHDELVYVVDEGPAEDLLGALQAVLRTPPKWWPQLVVWSEGDVADTYGDAK